MSQGKQYIQPAVSHGSPTCSVCPREAASSALACCPVQQPAPPTHFCCDFCENDSHQCATVTLISYNWCTNRLYHEGHTRTVYPDLVLIDDGLCKDYPLTSERHNLFFVFVFIFMLTSAEVLSGTACDVSGIFSPIKVLFELLTIHTSRPPEWCCVQSWTVTQPGCIWAETHSEPTCQHQRRDLVFTH